MPVDDELRGAVRDRLVPEVETALQSAPDVRAWPRGWAGKGEVEYFYRSGALLTGETDAARVTSVLDELGAHLDTTSGTRVGIEDPQATNLPPSGIRRLHPRIPESRHTPDLVEDLERRFGVGVVTHEHVFHVTGVCMCPATEPQVVITPEDATVPALVEDVLWPPPGDPAAGRDVQISVVDTGLLAGVEKWAPWLTGVRPDSRADIENPDRLSVDSLSRGRDGFADPYAGHGSFVAGVIRCLAPASSVRVERVIGLSGFVAETEMIRQIRQGLDLSPDVISMSAGGYTRHNVPPLALQALWDQRLRPLNGVVLVAAAGNDGQTRPFWPAAFDWCVGVGSTTKDGQRRSWFSNHGSWVDVYAPGEQIVNAYPRMKYKTVVDGQVRDTSAGIVEWSGTSFSTPIVSGLIAARMSRTGENGRQAAQALLTAARGQFRPGIGPRLFP